MHLIQSHDGIPPWTKESVVVITQKRLFRETGNETSWEPAMLSR